MQLNYYCSLDLFEISSFPASFAKAFSSYRFGSGDTLFFFYNHFTMHYASPHLGLSFI